MALRNRLKLTTIGMTVSMMALFSSSATADDVINDDIIGTESACVGNSCVDGESFGYDTLRLKEDNVRIHFEDSSDAASFPSADWRIVANDRTNGGSNYLAIEDSGPGTQPFRVDQGAGSNALRIDSEGDVGLGTASPLADLHIASGNTPIIRLGQTTADGWQAQIFDIAANEANFYIRDSSNGNQLPFRIKPGADTNSLVIAANNNIGLGTSDPEQALHVSRIGATVYVEDSTSGPGIRTQLYLENEGGAIMALKDSSEDGNNWNIAGSHKFIIGRFNQAADFTIDTSGNATIRGALTTGGTMCGNGCDKVFEDGFDLPSIEEHAKAMWRNGYLPNVGPTIENTPINVTDKLGRMLNELEKAHIYIAGLNEQNKDMAVKNQSLAAANAALHKRLERIEEKLQ